MLKWENRADHPDSDRYLVLIAYVIGVSIAVHLLNLLCIPALGLIYYYRRSSSVSAKGSLIAWRYRACLSVPYSMVLFRASCRWHSGSSCCS